MNAVPVSRASYLRVLSTARSYNPPSSSICRCFSTTAPTSSANSGKSKTAREREKIAKQKAKKNRNPQFKTYDLKKIDQYSLCDAMRYLQAAEVRHKPDNIKYEAHVKLKTNRSGPVIRQNQIQLPHPVKSDKVKYAIICPPDSKVYKEAKAAGHYLVGQEEIFEELKEMKFDRCIAHPNSVKPMASAGLPRILGPRGLMPNVKNGTVTADPMKLLRQMMGGAVYRERFGCVRLAVGTLAYKPEMLRDNLQSFLKRIREEISRLPQNAVKSIDEVVLSSSTGPGISLNGTFASENSLSTAQLSAA
ncbi:50S ribosomal protein L1 [Cyphellophora attinorum]|uniref:50S ribosomal protein L1 n=1 Tax=Cyphellophora attinorum TaxID=1664694 RepID=A0A0N0NHV8_9EURO|nr:50S ribosomal protein L1 [Phialophora attinorum]KPI35018.1 50S ribosomal protein L1 [Phialophora attinorum]